MNADLTEVIGPGVAAGRLCQRRVPVDLSCRAAAPQLPRRLRQMLRAGAPERIVTPFRRCDEAFAPGTNVALKRPHENNPSRVNSASWPPVSRFPPRRPSPRRRRPRQPRPARRDLDRGAGPLQGDKAPRARSQALNLDQLPLVDSQRFDAQYGASHAFRGVALANVIASFAPEPALDVAILHFANGMAVPVPFRDAETMKRLDPFIARGMETHPEGPVRAGFFPEIRRKGATEDPRPIVFSGNKMVVAVLWHPRSRRRRSRRSRPGATPIR